MSLTQKELDTLRWLEQRQKYNRLAYFEPYPKQALFIELSATHRELMMIAANRVGKSQVGAYITAVHLTGEYPEWWKGKRFDHAIKAWAAGDGAALVRDVQQDKLCGAPGVTEEFGTGFIPKHLFMDKPSMGHGVTDGYDTIQVRHKSGGISTLTFKSYDQGRTKFQAATLDFIWLDEEPKEDIYSECLTRIATTQGVMITTYTPLKGKTPLTNRFLVEKDPSRAYVQMTIYEADHILNKEEVIAGYPDHEREARAYGVPLLGSGRVYNFSDAQVKAPYIREVPIYWAKLWGVDFGLSQSTSDHAFGALLAVWDRDEDILYIRNEIKLFGQSPLQHSYAMKEVAAVVPVAWPHDGHKTSAGDSGETIATAAIYRKLGLKMSHEHSTFLVGGYSVEAGVAEICHLIEVGKLKFCEGCVQLFDEFRGYYRDKGIIVAKQDDLLSALRQIIMMRRIAKTVPLGSEIRQRNEKTIAEDIDFPLF